MLQSIHRIASNVMLTHEEAIDALLKIGLRHFNLDVAIVSRVISSEYTVESCVDVTKELKPLTQFDLSGTYCAHTIKEDKTLGFHYVGKGEIRNHSCYKNFKLESYIGTPIKMGEELYGTINFSSARPSEPFCKDDYILMDLLSDVFGYILYKKRSEEEMISLSRVDELTGLLNRRATLERLNNLIELSRRSGSPLTVLSIDIDHFKSINDTFGHAAGDTALIEFSLRASTLGRQTDFCGRLGGEEFIFVLPGASQEHGLQFAGELRKQIISKPVTFDNGESVTMTVSGGVATLKEGEPLKELLARADHAMYKAKQGGRDQFCLADE